MKAAKTLYSLIENCAKSEVRSITRTAVYAAPAKKLSLQENLFGHEKMVH